MFGDQLLMEAFGKHLFPPISDTAPVDSDSPLLLVVRQSPTTYDVIKYKYFFFIVFL